MAEKSVAMKVVEKIAKQAAIKKVVNKKFSKSQHQDRTVPVVDAIFDAGERFFKSLGNLIYAAWTVLYIIPSLAIGLLEGLSQGLLKGLQKATESYEKKVTGK